jgi:hypothetical protein
MSDHDDYFLSSRDDPMAALDHERRKLDDLSEVWKDEKTVVKAKDQSFSMTFDGRGDLTDISFNGTKYRNLAPAEFAHLLLTTLQAGRIAALEKMAEVMSGSLPGVDLVGLATGKVNPREVLDGLIAPMMNEFAPAASLGRPGAAQPASRNGWEA